MFAQISGRLYAQPVVEYSKYSEHCCIVLNFFFLVLVYLKGVQIVTPYICCTLLFYLVSVCLHCINYMKCFSVGSSHTE